MTNIPVLYPIDLLNNLNFIYQSKVDVMQVGLDTCNLIEHLYTNEDISFMYYDSFYTNKDFPKQLYPRYWWQWETLKQAVMCMNPWTWIWWYPESTDFEYKIEYLGNCELDLVHSFNFHVNQNFICKNIHENINLSQRTLLHHDYSRNYLFGNSLHIGELFPKPKTSPKGLFIVYYEHFNNFDIIIQASVFYWLEAILPALKFEALKVPTEIWHPVPKPLSNYIYRDHPVDKFLGNHRTWKFRDYSNVIYAPSFFYKGPPELYIKYIHLLKSVDTSNFNQKNFISGIYDYLWNIKKK